MKKIIAFIIITACMILTCLTACSASKDKSADEAAPPLCEFEPVTEIVEGQTNIYLIIKVVDSAYWQVIINGVKDAGERFNCNVYCGGTTIETDWQGQRKLIEEAANRHADAILLSPDDSVELAPDIEAVHNLDIPIVLIDTAANTDSYDKCYMTDNLLAGQKAAEEMIKQLKMSGHIANKELQIGIMVGTAASQTINERLAGFYKYWSENAPDKWTIISDIMNCNGKVELGNELAHDFLKNHPEVSGLYGTNNSPTRAICQVVKEEERRDLVVVGFDYSDEIKELIESSDYHASTMLQRQYDMGYKGVATVVGILKHKTISVRFEDTGVVTVNHMTLTNPSVMEVLANN